MLCGSHYQKSILPPSQYSKVATLTRHYISNADYDLSIGTCSVCGVGSPIYVRTNGSKVCRTKIKERQSNRVRLPSKQTYVSNYYYVYGDGKRIDKDVIKKSRERLRAAQNNRCAICEKPESEIGTLCLDHCHETGQIRGLLCRKCNSGIGLLGDDIDLVRSAVLYLSR